jgi:hypothetical protein
MFIFILGIVLSIFIGLVALIGFICAFDRSKEGFLGDFFFGLLGVAWAFVMVVMSFNSEVGKNDVATDLIEPLNIVTNENSLSVFYHNEENGDVGVVETSKISDFKADKLWIQEIHQHNIKKTYLSSRYEIINATENGE